MNSKKKNPTKRWWFHSDEPHGIESVKRIRWPIFWFPDAPCREYWPTFPLECGHFSLDVSKYFIHGASGVWLVVWLRNPWEVFPETIQRNESVARPRLMKHLNSWPWMEPWRSHRSTKKNYVMLTNCWENHSPHGFLIEVFFTRKVWVLYKMTSWKNEKIWMSRCISYQKWWFSIACHLKFFVWVGFQPLYISHSIHGTNGIFTYEFTIKNPTIHGSFFFYRTRPMDPRDKSLWHPRSTPPYLEDHPS